jgi:hypothetical protein
VGVARALPSWAPAQRKMVTKEAQLGGEVIASQTKGEKAMLEIQLRYEAKVSALKGEITGVKALSVVRKVGETESTQNVAQPQLRKAAVLPGKAGK